MLTEQVSSKSSPEFHRQGKQISFFADEHASKGAKSVPTRWENLIPLALRVSSNMSRSRHA